MEKSTAAEEPPTANDNEAAPKYLVVVGSSAGGIEALSTFASSLPSDFSAAIVIAQHLDPARPSRLEEILSRDSALPVRTVTDHDALHPGMVYVVPSNRQIEISDHAVVLQPISEPGPRPSVDLLFSSAAASFGENLIAVVLSGTGSDGAAGARLVHEAGGTVIIQNPETAAFSGMPRSLAPVTVDIVAELEEIGPLLQRLITEGSSPLGEPAQAAPDEREALRAILRFVRDERGIDFSGYRQPTIWRRLQRRLIATHTETPRDYLAYLTEHPDELEQIVGSFLIKVTDFFRDPKTFAYLRDKALPELYEAARQRADSEGLRIWSAGCATGEEAYSLAILVSELLKSQPPPDRIPVRIFATDVDESAIGFARRGIYPAGALKNVPDDLLERYFQETDSEYEIDGEARGLVVFGPHDLTQAPPFPRIDLVMCRNVLMYFTAELQRRALQALTFALREGGYLVLGAAETTRPMADGFTTADSALKIFRRTGYRVLFEGGHAAPGGVRQPTRLIAEPRRQTPYPSTSMPRLQRAQPAGVTGTESLLLHLPTGVVVVDRRYDVHYINPAARRLLGVHGLANNEDLIHLLTSVDTTALRATIDSVFREGREISIDEMATAELGMGQERFLQIICAPRQRGTTATTPEHAEQATHVEQAIIIVNDVTQLTRERRNAERARADDQHELQRLTALMEQMGEKNQLLLDANDELAMAEEALRTTQEQYAVSSAEAQAATEELETYAEELQATTEELETLNEELRSTVEELSVSNTDLDARAQELTAQRQVSEEGRAQLGAILASMGDAVLVVDSAGRPLRTNAAYDALVADADAPFIPRDNEGLPLPGDETPQARAARGEAFLMEFTVLADDGTRRWFEANGRPISDQPGATGVVVIRDISERSLRQFQELFVGRTSHELRTPLTALHGYLQLLIRQLEAGVAPDRLTRFATNAFDQAQRLDQLVAELLDVTRLRSGTLELHLAPLDLVAMVRQVIEVAQSVAEGQTIELEAELPSLEIDGDANRLEGVLYNLLTNAIKYAPDTDRIRVRLREIDDAVEIQVIDRGPGIAEAELNNIFSGFYQIARDDYVGRSGLGLGLYIAREIVNAHGGSITASSQEGEGATFTVRLPLRQAAEDGATYDV